MYVFRAEPDADVETFREEAERLSGGQAKIYRQPGQIIAVVPTLEQATILRTAAWEWLNDPERKPSA